MFRVCVRMTFVICWLVVVFCGARFDCRIAVAGDIAPEPHEPFQDWRIESDDSQSQWFDEADDDWKSPGGWASVEGLVWWARPMNLPPLASTSPPGTPQISAGVIGQPGTRILYGGNSIFDEAQAGMRFRGGFWLDQSRMDGIGAEYLFLAQQSEHFQASSSGDPILSRPFNNVLTGLRDAELVAFPGVLAGTVTVDVQTRLQSFGIHYRRNLAHGGCVESSCGPCDAPTFRGQWLGVLAGYRFVDLDESLTIREALTDLTDPNTVETFAIRDKFAVKNDFHGAELGLYGGWRRNRWRWDSAVRIGLGVTEQEARISGHTAQTVNGVTTTFPGGLLAQRTNSGSYSRQRFGMVPQFELKGSYQVTQYWHCSLGYSVLYWQSVLRVGDQVDPFVNTNLLPPEVVPFTGPLRPAMPWQQSGYWAQGLTFGIERRW